MSSKWILINEFVRCGIQTYNNVDLSMNLDNLWGHVYLYLNNKYSDRDLERIVNKLYKLWFHWFNKSEGDNESSWNYEDRTNWKWYIAWYNSCEWESYTAYIEINTTTNSMEINYDYLYSKYNILRSIVKPNKISDIWTVLIMDKEPLKLI